MITLQQRIIKLSSWDRELLHDFQSDTHEQSFDFEWLRLKNVFPFAFITKPWAGKVSLDKTQFKIISLNTRRYGRNRSAVVVYGKMIVINNERWLKLTYKLFWYTPIGIVLYLAFLAYVVLDGPADNFLWLFMAALATIPIFSLYSDLRQTDRKILAYIHESRTKVYDAAVAARAHSA
jgi:hypothetical protein